MAREQNNSVHSTVVSVDFEVSSVFGNFMLMLNVVFHVMFSMFVSNSVLMIRKIWLTGSGFDKICRSTDEISTKNAKNKTFLFSNQK